MTTLQMCDRFRVIMRNELDGFVGHDATDEQIVTVLNEALDKYGDYNPKEKRKIAFSVTAAMFEIDLRSIFQNARQVREIYRNGLPLCEMLPAQFQASYPMAEYTSDGEPSHYTKLEPTKILFNRPVSASAAAGTWTATIGFGPTSLNHLIPAAIPDLPNRLHPFIVKYAIWIASAGYAMNSDQAQTVDNFRTESLMEFRRYDSQLSESTLGEIFARPNDQRFNVLDLSQ